jgi:hypothetical protein
MIHAYRYMVHELAHPGMMIAELPLTDVTWGRMLNGAAEFSGKLKLPPPTTPETRLLLSTWRESTDRATNMIYVIRDGTPLGCYIIWDQSYSAADQTITVKGAEPFSYARRRIVEKTSGDLTTLLSFTGRPVDIAVAILLEINEIGLVFDTGAGTGTAITKQYRGTDNRSVADEILELAALDDGGFDFRNDIRISSSDEPECVFMARENLGGTTEIVAKYETNVASLAVSRRGDLRANDAIVLGPTHAGDSSLRANKRRSTSDWGPTMTIVEAHSDKDEADSIMDNRAAALLAAFSNHELIEVSVAASSIDAQLGTYHPGDLMRLIVPADADPFFYEGIDETMRLLQFSVKVPDEGPGTEIVTLTLAAS